MIVAGLGFRSGVAPEEIMEVIERALAQAGLARNQLARLATAESRAAEPGLLDAARRLELEVQSVPPAQMAEVDPGVKTRSERVMRLHGVGSIAEAAALGAAGSSSRLVAARVSTDRATCALAAGAD